MAKAKKTIKYVNYNYVINEMTEDMHKAIQNITDVIQGQTELIDYLKKAENKKFDGFIKELENATIQYNEQLKILNHRVECVNALSDLSKTYVEVNYALALLLEAVGIANRDGKTLQERIDNKEDTEEVNLKYSA